MLKLMCAAAYLFLLEKTNLVRSSNAPLQQAVGGAAPCAKTLGKGLFFLLGTYCALSFVSEVTDQLCMAVHQFTWGWALQQAGQG